MESLSDVGRNVSVLRRMLFATSFLPSEIPKYLDIIAAFASEGDTIAVPEIGKVTMENAQLLTPKAFSVDLELTKELITMQCGPANQALGVPLVPEQIICKNCGGKLLIHSDQPSQLTLYTESLGTVPASHFHKYCRNYHKGCNFVQF